MPKINYTIARKDLLNAFKRLQPITLNYVAGGGVHQPHITYLSFEEEGVFLYQQSYERNARIYLSPPTGAREVICLVGSSVRDLLATMVDDDVTFAKKTDGNVQLHYGNSKATLKTFNAEFEKALALHLFKVPDKGNTISFTISPVDFSRLVRWGSIATSKDEARVNLQNIQMKIAKDEIVGYAADGFRLIKLSVPLVSLKSGAGKVLVASRTSLVPVLSLLGNGDITVVRPKDKDSVYFIGKDFLYFCLLPDENNYPDIEGVLSNMTERSNVVTANVALVQLGLTRAKIFNDLMAVLEMNSKDGFVNISGQNQELGNTQSVIVIDETGDFELRIGVNHRYLSEFLEIIAGRADTLLFSLGKTADKPIVVESKAFPTLTYVIMPMHLG